MFRDKPYLMGILNVTPDSFSDGGQYAQLAHAITHAKQMIQDGVDMLDIGGESTRPNAEPVDSAEQIRRVVPVIAAIRQFSDICISIDTTSSEVALAALDAGANMINDVSAGLADTQIFNVAALANVPIILMHMQGTPKTMQDNPFYENVVQEVIAHLQSRVVAAIAAGITQDKIILDVGIGFGKRKEDNLDLLAQLSAFVDLGFPILLGTSRKRFMGSICHIDHPQDLVTATAVTTALGIMSGVTLFRVHDVKENRQAADVAWAIKQRFLPKI